MTHARELHVLPPSELAHAGLWRPTRFLAWRTTRLSADSKRVHAAPSGGRLCGRLGPNSRRKLARQSVPTRASWNLRSARGANRCSWAANRADPERAGTLSAEIEARIRAYFAVVGSKGRAHPPVMGAFTSPRNRIMR